MRLSVEFWLLRSRRHAYQWEIRLLMVLGEETDEVRLDKKSKREGFAYIDVCLGGADISLYFYKLQPLVSC